MAERTRILQPAVAGLISAAVGFSSSFAVVLAGLAAAGASAAQAASGLAALCIAIAVGCIGFAVVTRRPIAIAWSTPGAALLAVTGAPTGGFATATGAFLVAGALVVLTGLVPQAAALIRRIPAGVASAMLAGVLLGLCVQPLRAFPTDPVRVGVLLAVWLVLQRLAPRWAVPGALVAGVGVLVASGAASTVDVGAGPGFALVAPAFTVQSVLSIALPLYLVTMTAQDIPGAAVMRSLGWEVPWRPAMVFTGAASMAASVLGGHAVNLAAITAALTAGPDAGEDRDRRWIAAVTAGGAYLVLGLATPLVVEVAAAAPAGLLSAFAGIALFSAFASAVHQATADERDRLAAAVALVVAASGVVVVGIGSAFWALAAGCAIVAVVRVRRTTAARTP